MLSTTDVNAGKAKRPIAVQYAARERGQRDKQQVWKRPAQHLDGQRELTFVFGCETGGADENDQRRGDYAQHRDKHQKPTQRACHRVNEIAHLFRRSPRAVLGDDRHEGLRESPLRKQPPQQVRDLVRENEDLERNGGHHRGVHHVARESGDARQERGESDDGGAAKESAAHERPRRFGVFFMGPQS